MSQTKQSMVDLFFEAQAAWTEVEKAKEEIVKLKEQLKLWKDELNNAETRLGQVLQRTADEEEENQ